MFDLCVLTLPAVHCFEILNALHDAIRFPTVTISHSVKFYRNSFIFLYRLLMLFIFLASTLFSKLPYHISLLATASN